MTYRLIALVLAALLAGCNTVAGLGKDVSRVGDKIEQKAEQKKGY